MHFYMAMPPATAAPRAEREMAFQHRKIGAQSFYYYIPHAIQCRFSALRQHTLPHSKFIAARQKQYKYHAADRPLP